MRENYSLFLLLPYSLLSLKRTQVHHFPLDTFINNGFTGYMVNKFQTNASNVPYYLNNLEMLFTDFLQQAGSSEKTRKNYKSDANHFLGWFIFKLESADRLPHSHIEFVQRITPRFVEQYKTFLLVNNIPTATINRRLSTIRSFFHFCQTQQWISDSPAKNLATVRSKKLEQSRSQEDILSSFARDLKMEGASRATIKNYVSDVRLFLRWKDIYAV